MWGFHDQRVVAGYLILVNVVCESVYDCACTALITNVYVSVCGWIGQLCNPLLLHVNSMSHIGRKELALGLTREISRHVILYPHHISGPPPLYDLSST